MRIWEFEDNKATPANLVREQDFILRVRRMQRLGMPCLVLNFVLSAIEPLAKDQKAFEATQKKLQAYAQATAGLYCEMSNGDSFIIWENPKDARLISDQAIQAALHEHFDALSQFLLTYHMPENYGPLRERANAYVELARTASQSGGDSQKIDESAGHLTAKNVDQIEHLLSGIDIRYYGRTQSLYRDAGGTWEKMGEEYFISFEDLRRERFPKLEVGRSEHFFFALCTLLDKKLLTMLAESYDVIEGRKVNLNLSIASVLGSAFAQFVRRVPQAQRSNICFELHRGDLLQDFSLTLDAIALIKREGFGIAIDSVTPNMVPYVNFELLPVDQIKVNVSGIEEGQEAAIRSALARLPVDKMVFFRCDNEQALVLGRELGVKQFQGWLIDDLATKNKA